MSRVEFAATLFYFLLFAYSSFSLGTLLLRLFAKITREKFNLFSAEAIGSATLLGLGILSYIALALGLAGQFNKLNLLVLLTVAAISGIPTIRTLRFPLFDNGHRFFRSSLKNVFPVIAIIITLVILSTLYLAAMQPPNASDELHYHFPQARQIVQTQKIDLSFGDELYYGNIPKQMEIIFAMGASVKGYALSHTLNFLIFLGLLCVVFDFIYKYFGLKAASYAILLLVLFDDFTWNATTGFVDSATVAMEIGALLFFFDWYLKNSKTALIISGLLLGLGFAIKYTPAPTALFITTLLLIKTLKSKNNKLTRTIKTLTIYALPIFFSGGFWYVKNIIKFGNPFYPFYFGHIGIAELEYQGIIQNVQQFSSKTLSNFLNLLGQYKTINGATVYLSYFAAPVSILVTKNSNERKLLAPLIIYIVFYSLYWFFFGSHQIRFLAPALIVSMVLASIFVSKISLKILIPLVIVTLLLLHNNPVYWKSFWNSKLHLTERQYALGHIDQREFLTRTFGCQYQVIRYLEDNKLEGTVIDNWSVWFAPSVSFYAEKNLFRPYSYTDSFSILKLRGDLEKDNIKYIYFNSQVKADFLRSTDPFVIQYKNSKLPTDEYLLKHSELFYQTDKCYLYKII